MSQKYYDESVKGQSIEFKYQLLDRLRTDCEYYLGNGARSEKHLFMDTAKDHVNLMELRCLSRMLSPIA